MAKTVVGLFNSIAEAEKVKQALLDDGYTSGKITVVANNTGHSEDSTTQHTGGKISEFFKHLTGGDDDVHEHYASGVNQGGGLLAATVDDDEVDEMVELLEDHGARNIDEQRAGSTGTGAYAERSEYGSAASDLSSTGYGGAAETGTAIPIVEESLAVGKREVDRGGVRVYSHVVEHPVAADVTLHDEFINVDRRYVDRPATAADFAAASGKVIELTATGEEAVVGKTSRVVEEVVVGKESSEHTEQINDSVRRTEVEVEEIPAVTTGGTFKDDRY